MSYGSDDFDVKDRVRQANDIVDLVGSFISLRRQGSSYVGLCPWHEDSRPSFQVNPARQSWACWVCGIRGDVFDFIMRWEGVEFRDSLKTLAERAGIPLNTQYKRVAKGSKDDKNALHAALKWAENEYHQCLLNSDAAIPIRDYLAERGITQESIETFKVGFAPLSWSWLVDRSRKTEFSPEILEACGLVMPNRNGGWYERFRGRVLFPIRDTLDRPIALGGRVVPSLYGDGEEVPPAKYVNSPETKLFSKSKNLYALNLCRGHIQKSDDKRLTIVEGYTDVIAAWQAGLRNVVAALGTAINEQHLRLIKRFADGVTLVLDGDDAGQKKANSVLDLFVSEDVDLRILSLPEGLDPFDFLMSNGAEAFQGMVDAAPDAIGHRIQTETAGIDLLNDTHRANQALDKILKTLARVPERQLSQSMARKMRHEQILMRLSRRFQLDVDQIRNRITELRKSERPLVRTTSTPQRDRLPELDPSQFDKAESELLQLLILEPKLLDFTIENVVPDEFKIGPLQDLYRAIEDCFHEGKDIDYKTLKLELEDAQLRSLVDYLFEEASAKKHATEVIKSDLHESLEKQMDTIVGRFRQARAQTTFKAKVSQLQSGQLEGDAEADALKELFEYQQQLQRNKTPK